MALAMVTASVNAEPDLHLIDQVQVGMYYTDVLALCGRTDHIYTSRAATGTYCQWVYDRHPYCTVTFLDDYVISTFVGRR